jgi:hypothetical protein
MSFEYVQYGCGWCAPEAWLNFDASPTLRFERWPLVGQLYTKNARRFPKNVRYGDIVEGLPLKAGSCAGIYCSHVLEHLALEDFQIALLHTIKYLKPGGTFRLVVPDLETLTRAYLADSHPLGALQFMEAAGLGRKNRVAGLLGLITESLSKGAHLWMWDEKAMAAQLARHGFRDIRRAQFGDAEDKRFDEVEDPARFAGCLAMQCRK